MHGQTVRKMIDTTNHLNSRETSHENAVANPKSFRFHVDLFALKKMLQEGLPECGEKRPAEQSLRELLICRVLQQQQISSILSMATVKNKDINTGSLGNSGSDNCCTQNLVLF